MTASVIVLMAAVVEENGAWKARVVIVLEARYSDIAKGLNLQKSRRYENAG